MHDTDTLHETTLSDDNVITLTKPTERLERLRIAAASRATLLRKDHLRLEDELNRLRAKAAER